MYDPQQKKAYRDVRFIFQDFLGRLPVIEVIEADGLGWMQLPSGQMVYIAGNDILGGECYPECKNIWIPEDIKNTCIETVSGASTDDAIQCFWNSFSLMPGISDVLLTYTFFSLISRTFREAGITPRFSLILEGTTEAKKTTLACLTCGVFMRKSALRSCIVGLTSTRSAVELRARELRDCVLVVDDLFPDGKASQREKALALIRDIANQDAREVKSGKTLVSNKLDCGVVFTAEFFPSCGRSTRTRCLRLKLNSRIPNATLQPLQENAVILGNVFKEFIRRTAISYPNVVQKIADDFHAYRRRRSEVDAPLVESERLAEIGFCLTEALDIFLELFPKSDSKEVLAGFQNRINRWVDWQLSADAAPDFNDFISYIPNIRRMHPEYFRLHQNCWCVNPDDLCMLVREHLGDPTITRTSMFKVLQDSGVLLKDRSNAATKKINGRRYLCLIPNRFTS